MRYLLLFLLLITVSACRLTQESEQSTTASNPTITDTISYTVRQNLTLVNDGPIKPNKNNLWILLIADHPPYQDVISTEIQPSNYTLSTDEYGNQYAEFDFKDLEPGSSIEIEITYEIAVNELTYPSTNCEGELIDEFNQSELHIESQNPQIVSLAESLSSSDHTACEQIRTFYDYIGDNLVYTYNGDDWGAQAALGEMGADCTEYSSLLMALSRANGIPARYVRGLLHLKESDSMEIRQEHAWVEVYFPGSGWNPIDPTLGRSTLTRELHFARYSPNHIIVSKGRNPSTLRGANYWSHLYWPGNSTTIRIPDAEWTITPH